MLDEHPDTKLYVVGEYGRHFFYAAQYPHGAQLPLYGTEPYHAARERNLRHPARGATTAGILRRFLSFIPIWRTASRPLHTARVCCRSTALISRRIRWKRRSPRRSSLYPPCRRFSNIMQSYVSGFIYSALIDSFCSEQNARMTAMDSANSNAEKLLAELSCSITACVRLPSRRRLQRSLPVRRHSVKNTGRKREQREYR